MIAKDELYSLEEYDTKRDDMRKEVMQLKKIRSISLGDHIRLLFENKATIFYQIQEMLRIEKIFDKAGITEELSAYNPLIPDGTNLKATMLIEYCDVEERKRKLAMLIDVENSIYFQVNEEQVYPICNEDLERSTPEKTSSVHFMRFEFTPEQIQAFKNEAKTVLLVCDHPQYHAEIVIEGEARLELIKDFGE